MASQVAVLEKPQIRPSSKLLVDSHNSLTAQFAKWLYKETTTNDGSPNGRIISASSCASKIQHLKADKKAVTDVQTRSWISAARVYFESNLNCTIWPIYGRGWRASTKVETAKFCGKSIRKTIAWADRTDRLFAITEKQHIPYALKEVFNISEGKIRNLSGMKKRFVERWLAYEEKQKIEGGDGGPKLLK